MHTVSHLYLPDGLCETDTITVVSPSRVPFRLSLTRSNLVNPCGSERLTFAWPTTPVLGLIPECDFGGAIEVLLLGSPD